MKILIINPPFYRLQGESLVHYPPSCCYIAAVLEQAGYNCKIYNSDFDPSKKTILGNTNHINVKALLSQAKEYDRRLNDENDEVWKEIKDYLFKNVFDVIIISVFSTTLTAGNKIAKMSKLINPRAITIFEGSTNRGLHCAVDPSVTADFNYMDFAVRRESEYTVLELIKALEKNVQDFSHIKGISWKKGDLIIHNPDREFIEDLDKLPFPARHLLDNYKAMPPHAFQGIYGSRGCPFDCIFCGCHTSWGYKPRLRSAENMVKEMEYVYTRFGTRYFYICDDIFFIKKDRAKRFCNLLIQKKLPLYWSAQTRAEMVDDETLSLVKKAGGQHIAVGVEVGNQAIRDLIKKGNTVDDVKNAGKLIKKHGLYMVAFTIVGLPWEGRKEIEDTVNLVKEINPYIVYPYMPTPASGTVLEKMVVEKNPEGLQRFRDYCHIDTTYLKSDTMTPDEKAEVLNWAMGEFTKINKKSLLKNIIERPNFYWALSMDMNFWKKPSFLFSYFRDFVKQ